jgi:hypothetical protein
MFFQQIFISKSHNCNDLHFAHESGQSPTPQFHSRSRFKKLACRGPHLLLDRCSNTRGGH